jgi:hypothetical protein
MVVAIVQLSLTGAAAKFEKGKKVQIQKIIKQTRLIQIIGKIFKSSNQIKTKSK